MARSPFSVVSEVVTRTKSSPLRANRVATPPVVRAKASGTLKSRLSGLPWYSSVGVSAAPTRTTRSGCSTKGSGNWESRIDDTLSVSPTLISWVASTIRRRLWIWPETSRLA